MGRRIGVAARARRVVAAATLATAAGGLTAGAAGAGTSDTFSDASGGRSACGWWWTETSERFVSASVCGIDGVAAQNGDLTQLPGPMVIVDRYSCQKENKARRKGEDAEGACSSDHFEGRAGPNGLSVDPLLQTARITATIGSCAVDATFFATSGPAPGGSVWEYHGLGAVPTVSLGAGQGVVRQASVTGWVCGDSLAEGFSDAVLTQGANVGITHGAPGGQDGE